MPKLVLPSVKYKKSFLEDFLKYQGKTALEWDSWMRYYKNKSLLRKDFQGFIKLLNSQSKGLNLPRNYVPQSVFWLTDKNRFLGIITIRHKLTERLKKLGGHIGYEIAKKFQGKGYGKLILKLGLKKAKHLGIKNVLIMCSVDNLRSRKVIENGGGKFSDKIKQGKKGPYKLRFWIKQ